VKLGHNPSLAVTAAAATWTDAVWPSLVRGERLSPGSNLYVVED